jgi:hypothetical protein
VELQRERIPVQMQAWRRLLAQSVVRLLWLRIQLVGSESVEGVVSYYRIIELIPGRNGGLSVQKRVTPGAE